MGSHSRAAGEGEVRLLERGKLSLESQTRGVATACIVEENGITGAVLSEG